MTTVSVPAAPDRRRRVEDNTSQTLLELLDSRAASLGGAIAFTALVDGEEPGRTISFAELAQAARSYAAQLADVVAPGSRVLLLMPAGIDFVVAFLGCLHAGAVPVPAPLPNRRAPESGVEVIQGIARDCNPSAVLCGAADIDWLQLALAGLAAGLPTFALSTEDGRHAASWQQPSVSAGSTVFLQYTSGSTSDPKGVVLSHANLMANLRIIAATVGADAQAPVTVSWLPLYHDLGLIGGVLGSLFTGGHGVLMMTESFLRRPTRWLRAISRFRADVSLAPNFAYDLVARATGVATVAGLDLSCWSVAINCSEPVRAQTLARFAATFSSCGFNPKSFFPCYGLAEASLLVTAASRGVGAIYGQDEPERVASGSVPATVALQVVDPRNLCRVSPGGEGEVWVGGPSVSAGYWGSKDASGAFGACLRDDPASGPWLRTGDLGRLLGGQLFVTGRLKDVITIAGRQLYPQDVELHVQTVDRRFKLGAGIAFGVERANGEVLAIAQETTMTDPATHSQAIRLLRASVFERFAVRLDTVILLRPGTIPKTLNGKLRRRACRTAFERGKLPALATSTGAESAA